MSMQFVTRGVAWKEDQKEKTPGGSKKSMIDDGW